jgi:hypothetical protein
MSCVSLMELGVGRDSYGDRGTCAIPGISEYSWSGWEATF